jgi:predicted phosphodiesterase
MKTRCIKWTACCVVGLVLAAAGLGYGLAPEVGEPTEVAAASSAPLWRFGFVGDTHGGGEMVDAIFSQLAQAHPEFVLHLGDMVDRGDSDAEWNALLEKADRHALRLMPVVGNHDVERSYHDRGEIRFRQHFPHLPRTFYHFSHRGLNFLMLNTELPLVPFSEQQRFLSWQLAEHPGTTIVCLHRPVFTCDSRDWAWVRLRQLWLHPHLVGSDAALVLAGHNHVYERTKPLDGVTYVVSGGGSPIHYEGRTPDQRTARVGSGYSHCGVVDVYEDRLVVRILDHEGGQRDQFQLALKPAIGSTKTLARKLSRELPAIETLPQFARRPDAGAPLAR